MKISNTSRVILGLGILVITLGSLGVARSQQLGEAQQLSENLSIANLRLSKLDLKDLISQQEKLDTQLSQAAAQRDKAKAALSQSNESVLISEAVFRIAWDSGVEVYQVSSSVLTTDKLNGVICTVLPVTVLVRGDVPNLIDFVMRLNQDFSIGVVKSVEFVVPRVTAGNRAESAAGTSTDNTSGTPTDITTGIITDNTTDGESDNMTGTQTIISATSLRADNSPSVQVQLAIYAYKG